MNAPSANPGALSAWLQATRPRTLTAAVGPVAVGASLAAGEGRHRWDVTLAALGVVLEHPPGWYRRLR